MKPKNRAAQSTFRVIVQRKASYFRLPLLLILLVFSSLLLAACGQITDSQLPAAAATEQPQQITSAPATIRIVAPTEQPPPIPGSDIIYIVDSNVPSENDRVSTILAVNTTSGKVVKRFPTRYRPVATLSPDGSYLYVVDSYFTRVVSGDFVHAITAIDTRTGERLWETNLPDKREIYMAVPFDKTILTSKDGAFIYIRFNGQSIITVSTVSHQIVKESNPGISCQRLWQTGQPDALVAFCQDQTIILEPSTGKQIYSLPVPELQSPKNSTSSRLYDGDVAKLSNQLYLLNSASNLFLIDLNSRTAAQKIKINLPGNKQLPTFGGIAVSPDGKSLYVGVRSTSSTASDPGWGPMSDEVVVFDTTTWQSQGVIRLSQTAYKVNLSSDGQWLYALNPSRKTLSIIDTKKLTEVKVVSDLGNTPALIIAR